MGLARHRRLGFIVHLPLKYLELLLRPRLGEFRHGPMFGVGSARRREVVPSSIASPCLENHPVQLATLSVQETLAGRAPWALVHGEAFATLRELPSACVDAVITDPPYSSGGFTRGDRSDPTSNKYVQTGTKIVRPDFAGDNRDQHAFLTWCALWMSECLRVAKPGSPICVFSDWRQLPSVTDAIQVAGFIWRGLLVWDKTEAVRPCLGRFSSQCEYVVWGSAGPMPERADIGVLHGVIREPVDRSDKHHIAGKPTAVMKAIARICPNGGVILDPFAGSGTTGVGALTIGRRFIGFELIEEYAGVARDRLAATVTGLSLEAYRAGQIALFHGD